MLDAGPQISALSMEYDVTMVAAETVCSAASIFQKYRCTTKILRHVTLLKYLPPRHFRLFIGKWKN